MIPPEVTRWIRDRRARGCGEGTGADYQPWLSVRDFSSHGNVHRPLGRNGRTYQLFSTREYKCFLLLQWSPLVVDVREQFPLHPLEETLEIAAAVGVRHPVQTRKRMGRSERREEPMTTDFLVTLQDGPALPRYVAVSVKAEDALNESPRKVERLLQKAEFERRYFAARGVPFRVVTDADMPAVRCANIDLVLPCLRLEGLTVDPATVPAHLRELYDALRSAPGRALGDVCADADRRHSAALGASLTLVWHAIASRSWLVDMDAPLNPELPLSELRMPTAGRSGSRGWAA